eukprot:CAMPEP_0176090282 /NCGR_PEP_ID=MMETSP0120_2-20121206/45214_1 /TAXON_ID=160619 /ORGANISM="Kryptoperidinium foliaceum, Strain CCMP 1326" /LENGTH=50 /DNA_ID=CAMNT_0017424161 /DNA_START=41 /DNA_END=193 /DNA_ORIENTATION=-
MSFLGPRTAAGLERGAIAGSGGLRAPEAICGRPACGAARFVRLVAEPIAG